ncbi:MAG: SUMF1/EgtB/PvdO family nonheme iron enzyme [Nostoc sp. NMS1]|uniref:SAV_2336 N-terminal domain-related protein n=1 Tax=Nostoc sp. NMS1 TaxID=2815388 RepID=UPI0025FB23FD|nr:SAV_2336 N-terminal domain-related protein [Nostoc sp. NMS1]MBN3908322.1 SUMF1/EgtB/PvdO family nonheme iron enzyme [Nostoc sp. NMS1]
MSAPSEKDNPKLPEAEINLTAQELADIIWLMVQIKPSIDIVEVASVPTQDNSPIISSPPPNSESIDFPEIVKPIEDTTPAYVAPLANHSSESAWAGLPLKVTDPLALRNTLALGRSLRPLMRKSPSLTEMILNEEATVTSIAEKDFWLPVLQPVSTRWLEVALVIEETARYPLWRQILTEFQQLLERHGAFRNVSLWHLKMGNEGEVQLYLKHRQASLKELNDPSVRRLIWLVSDCVSPIWHNGSLLKVLRDWARIQPVSLLQLLPERLWSRTALSWGMEVQLYSENPGVPNARLSKTRLPVDTQFNSPQALTLPIVTLESFPMKNWAKVLAGVGGSRTPGLVFLPEKITPQASANDDEDNQLSPKARVSRFQSAASLLSRQLAQMMAAAPVSLPVIRLIQQTLLPNSHAVHLAEVLMGGLLKPTAEQPRNQVNEEVNYEFYPGVREELIKITRKSQTIDVILCLSEFINRELKLRQPVRNFEAILFNPDIKIDPDYLPFADITAQTLQVLGGKYAEMGEQIQHKIFQSNTSNQNPIIISEPEKLKRIFIFIDGDNLNPAVSPNSQFDYQKFLMLVQKRTSSCQAYFYLSVTKNKTKKKLLNTLKEYGYQIRTQKVSTGSKSDIDSLIITDLISLSQAYDIAILVSGDSDFVEPVCQLQSRGKSVEIISFSSGTSSKLIEVADNYLDLSSEPIELVALPTEKFETVTVNRRGEVISHSSKVARYFTETIAQGIFLQMVSIPGGKFMMGSQDDEAERYDDESPQHEVTVPSFFMGKYPITQAQWRVVAALEQVNRELNPDPSNFKNDNLPVEGIFWYEAVEFCDRLTEHTNRHYRLPSEAEWEYACRAGTITPFHFGQTITSELANYKATDTYGAGVKGIDREETTEVGSFKVANAFGLYDMHGNVWEWCLDDWHSHYEEAPTNGNPWFQNHYPLSQKQGNAVVRGGSWNYNPSECRSASRGSLNRAESDLALNFIGFRVVCEVKGIIW